MNPHNTPSNGKRLPYSQTSTLPKAKSGNRGSKVSTIEYPYFDSNGKRLYWKERHEYADGSKTFLWKHKKGARVDNGRGDAIVVPFNYSKALRAVDAGESIYIVEGEKCAQILNDMGRVAITNPDGAGKWGQIDDAFLASANVIVLPDNDVQGDKHAIQVCTSLYGKAASLKRLDLPGLPDKGDIFDWLQTNTPEQLNVLISEAPEWTPVDSCQAPPVLTLDDILDLPPLAIDFVVDELLVTGGISILAGPPKAGKSTLIRNIALRVAQGQPVLNRKCTQGPVFYYSLEERPHDVQQHFAAMGTPRGLPMFLRCGPIAPDEFLKVLSVDVKTHKPLLIIIDKLFDILPVKDSNSYVEINSALRALLAIARDSESYSHILLTHHTNRATEEFLGSQALFGGVDALVTMSKRKDGRTLRCEMRGHGLSGFDDTYLLFDNQTGVVTFGNPMDEDRTARLTEEMLEVLGGEELTTTDWDNRINGKQEFKSRARNELLKEGIVDRGKRGRNWVWFKADRDADEVPF